MNKFEASFFEKYIPEWQEIKWIIHVHFIEIFSKLFLWLTLWALLPSFLYFYSDRLKEFIPFFFLEWFLIIIFIKVIYDIFDWYNDVWIITNAWIVQLQRSLLKNNTNFVEYDKMEWMEVDQNWLADKVLKKWDITIHKFWEDSMHLNKR